jgi:hypothetical protein
MEGTSVTRGLLADAARGLDGHSRFARAFAGAPAIGAPEPETTEAEEAGDGDDEEEGEEEEEGDGEEEGDESEGESESGSGSESEREVFDQPLARPTIITTNVKYTKHEVALMLACRQFGFDFHRVAEVLARTHSSAQSFWYKHLRNRVASGHERVPWFIAQDTSTGGRKREGPGQELVPWFSAGEVETLERLAPAAATSLTGATLESIAAALNAPSSATGEDGAEGGNATQAPEPKRTVGRPRKVDATRRAATPTPAVIRSAIDVEVYFRLAGYGGFEV